MNFTTRILEATNRHFGGPNPIQFDYTVLKDTFDEDTDYILGTLSVMSPLLPDADGTLEVKWGHDDEANFGSLPPNEGDGPDQDSPTILETVAFQSWTVQRTANAVYIVPHGNSGGPVTIWFTPKGE